MKILYGVILGVISFYALSEERTFLPPDDTRTPEQAIEALSDPANNDSNIFLEALMKNHGYSKAEDLLSALKGEVESRPCGNGVVLAARLNGNKTEYDTRECKPHETIVFLSGKVALSTYDGSPVKTYFLQVLSINSSQEISEKITVMGLAIGTCEDFPENNKPDCSVGYEIETGATIILSNSEQDGVLFSVRSISSGIIPITQGKDNKAICYGDTEK